MIKEKPLTQETAEAAPEEILDDMIRRMRAMQGGLIIRHARIIVLFP